MEVDVTAIEKEKHNAEDDAKRLQEFARTLTHDLRNPINVLDGYLGQVRKHGMKDHYMDELETHVERMDEIVEETLKIARKGMVVDDPEWIYLHDAVQLAWDGVETYDAQLRLDIDKNDPPRLQADDALLRELLENLFRNAIDHVGEDAIVTIGSFPGPKTGFYLEDNGDGIPVDKLENIFEPGETIAEDGTGFGLSIVQKIVDAHGWEITASNNSSGGARFEIGVAKQEYRGS
jgi:signal transduction histidine kinase